MDIDEITEIQTTYVSVIATGILDRYNLVDVKYGTEHVASSTDEHTKVVSAWLGLRNFPENDRHFLNWIAVPIDKHGFVIKKDSQEHIDKFNATPNNYSNTIHGEIAAEEFMKHQTDLDEVEKVLVQLTLSRVWTGLNAIIEGEKFTFRRLNWLENCV